MLLFSQVMSTKYIGRDGLKIILYIIKRSRVEAKVGHIHNSTGLYNYDRNMQIQQLPQPSLETRLQITRVRSTSI